MIMILSALLLSDAFAQDPQTVAVVPGSMWNESAARRMAGLDNSARSVGDLVTVVINESARTQISADTSTQSSGNNAAGITTLFGLRNAITSANPNMGGELGVGTDRSFSFDGSGDTSRSSATEAILACSIIEVTPNGNLKIEGTKSVRTNHETQHFILTGVVRPQDIQANNYVQSNLIANLNVEVTGSGVLNDDQRVPFGTRVLKALWPF
ncbi:MAG: flagellar basal body L-ring protein FlgH [Myxococcota bacterium]